MKSELKISIARNLLEDKTCDNCYKVSFCSIKLGKEFGTCRKWKEAINIEIVRKLNVIWSKLNMDFVMNINAILGEEFKKSLDEEVIKKCRK